MAGKRRRPIEIVEAGESLRATSAGQPISHLIERLYDAGTRHDDRRQPQALLRSVHQPPAPLLLHPLPGQLAGLAGGHRMGENPQETGHREHLAGLAQRGRSDLRRLPPRADHPRAGRPGRPPLQRPRSRGPQGAHRRRRLGLLRHVADGLGPLEQARLPGRQAPPPLRRPQGRALRGGSDPGGLLRTRAVAGHASARSALCGRSRLRRLRAVRPGRRGRLVAGGAGQGQYRVHRRRRTTHRRQPPRRAGVVRDVVPVTARYVAPQGLSEAADAAGDRPQTGSITRARPPSSG